MDKKFKCRRHKPLLQSNCYCLITQYRVRLFDCAHRATQRYTIYMTTSLRMGFVNLMILVRKISAQQTGLCHGIKCTMKLSKILTIVSKISREKNKRMEAGEKNLAFVTISLLNWQWWYCCFKIYVFEKMRKLVSIFCWRGEMNPGTPRMPGTYKDIFSMSIANSSLAISLAWENTIYLNMAWCHQ